MYYYQCQNCNSFSSSRKFNPAMYCACGGRAYQVLDLDCHSWTRMTNVMMDGFWWPSRENFNILYDRVLGTQDNQWYVPANIPNPGDHIIVDSPRDRTGFGGATIKLLVRGDDPQVVSLRGPWHSNSSSLFSDTGVDLRGKHVTMGIVSKDKEFKLSLFKEVLFLDVRPKVGSFNRVQRHAWDISKKLGIPVHFLEVGSGGSSEGGINATKNPKPEF